MILTNSISDDETTKNMIDISYQNLDDLINNRDCPNKF